MARSELLRNNAADKCMDKPKPLRVPASYCRYVLGGKSTWQGVHMPCQAMLIVCLSVQWYYVLMYTLMHTQIDLFILTMPYRSGRSGRLPLLADDGSSKYPFWMRRALLSVIRRSVCIVLLLVLWCLCGGVVYFPLGYTLFMCVFLWKYQRRDGG